MNRRRFLRSLGIGTGTVLLTGGGDRLAVPHRLAQAVETRTILRERFPLPPSDVDVIGRVQVVRARAEQTVLDIGRIYGVGFEGMRLANPEIDLWVPGEGTEVTVPSRYILPDTPRDGLVINLPEMRIFYYPQTGKDAGQVVETYAISIGRMDWATPVGVTRVTSRIENPAWFPPESVRQRVFQEEGRWLPARVEPGPDNPLGDYAVGLDLPGYFIHGTNRPFGVGMRASSGCIRMYPEDIADLVYRLPVGTTVRIVNTPYKAGWVLGSLFFQAFPVLEEDREQWQDRAYEEAVNVVVSALGRRQARIDYPRLKEAVDRSDGLLVNLTREGSPLLG